LKSIESFGSKIEAMGILKLKTDSCRTIGKNFAVIFVSGG